MSERTPYEQLDDMRADREQGTADRATLLHAAELLEDAAHAQRELTGAYWRKRYADLLATARALREMAG